MENQVYRLEDGSSVNLEFWICDSNDIEPIKDIKEIAITLEDGESRYDFDLDIDSTKSLIKYLKESLKYVEKYNKNSKPKETE